MRAAIRPGNIVPLILSLSLALTSPADASADEARVTLDVKDADALDVIRVIAEAAGFQAVFDPGAACRLTLKLREVRWPTALKSTLRSCRLGVEQQGKILRIAELSRLESEATAQRRLKEAQKASRTGSVESYRLSYARAEQLAPLLARMLEPHGEVTYDSRTNTLIIVR